MSFLKSKTAKTVGLLALATGVVVWAKKAYAGNGNNTELPKPYTWGDKIKISKIINGQVVVAQYNNQVLRVNKNNAFKVPAQNAIIRANIQNGKAIGLRILNATTNQVITVINKLN